MGHRDLRSLLTIGEFSAATRLSPKALRLYDDENVLRPTEVDASNGYRYYSREQIATARWIRILREMDIPLATIRDIVTAPRARADALLSHAGQDLDRRYARQKRAFQAGLAMLHRVVTNEGPTVDVTMRSKTATVIHSFFVQQGALLRQLRLAELSAREIVASAGLRPTGSAIFRLVEPFAEDEARLECAVPVAPPGMPLHAVVLQEIPPARCATASLRAVDLSASTVEATLDALFDWLDRSGLRANECPTLALSEHSAQLNWSYQFLAEESQ